MIWLALHGACSAAFGTRVEIELLLATCGTCFGMHQPVMGSSGPLLLHIMPDCHALLPRVLQQCKTPCAQLQKPVVVRRPTVVGICVVCNLAIRFCFATDLL